jgi:hypothetical protein
MRAQFQYVVAHEPGPAAKAVAPAIAVLLAVAFAVPVVNHVVWPRAPNWAKLETLGSTRYVGDADAVGGPPNWHAVNAGRAWLESPLRFPKVALRQGQTLKVAYAAEGGRDGFRLTVYRSEGLFQGVADFKSATVEAETAASDVMTYVAPRDGLYVVAPEPLQAEPASWPQSWFAPVDVTYDVTWAIERVPHAAADDAAQTVLPQLRR